MQAGGDATHIGNFNGAKSSFGREFFSTYYFHKCPVDYYFKSDEGLATWRRTLAERPSRP